MVFDNKDFFFSVTPKSFLIEYNPSSILDVTP
jgi:hypothetical protein